MDPISTPALENSALSSVVTILPPSEFKIEFSKSESRW